MTEFWFWVMWIVQIGFGVYVYINNPKVKNLSDKADRFRNIAIFGGLFPWVGFMLVAQIVALITYRAQVAKGLGVGNKLQSTLPTSFGPSQPNNQSQLSDQTEPRMPASDNPFM